MAGIPPGMPVGLSPNAPKLGVAVIGKNARMESSQEAVPSDIYWVKRVRLAGGGIDGVPGEEFHGRKGGGGVGAVQERGFLLLGIPPQRLGISPQRLGIPPQRLGIPPQRLGIPPQRLGIPPQRLENHLQRWGETLEQDVLSEPWAGK